jgi:haloalkane dehalogenase
MKVLRTPEARFENLPDFAYEPNYVELPDGDGGMLRMAYVDVGLRDAQPVLLTHGEPSWSFLNRKMIPVITAAGHRAVAPDLIGFGRSDKPSERSDYTYQRHVDWMRALIEALDLRRLTLVGQDWGGMIGLRLAAEEPGRFDRIVATNTLFPTGDQSLGEAFESWKRLSQSVPDFPAGSLVNGASGGKLPPEIIAAYDAPFPDESYKAGARVFPLLVPTSPDDPATPANRAAWEMLSKWKKPFLTAFSDNDPITRPNAEMFQRSVPGAEGQPHVTIEGAGHFVQEDKGRELAEVVVDFIHRTPT